MAGRLTADTYIDVLDTFSGHIAWEQWKRDKLYAEVRRLIAQRPKDKSASTISASSTSAVESRGRRALRK